MLQVLHIFDVRVSICYLKPSAQVPDVCSLGVGPVGFALSGVHTHAQLRTLILL
jgi:hypothetical protein